LVIAISVIIAYLLGAIPFALVIGRLAGVKDIRSVGSGNLGATNVWRAAGPTAGLAVLIADAAKGAGAVLIARLLMKGMGAMVISTDVALVLVGLAAVLGHVFPVYLGFRGGKGVATGLGVMVVLLPWPTAGALVVFLVVAFVWRYVSLASICAALALFGVVVVERQWLHRTVADVYFLMTLVLLLLMIVTHRHNIARLVKGTENRFSLSSRSSGGGRG